MKLSMEELVEFLQETLAKDFFFEDDFVIEQLQVSMAELKRAKLDLPEPGKNRADPPRPGHGPSHRRPYLTGGVLTTHTCGRVVWATV